MRRVGLALCVWALACSSPQAPVSGATPDSLHAVRAATARATIRHWLDAAPTPNDEDLATLRKQWTYYARPTSVRVMHLALRVHDASQLSEVKERALGYRAQLASLSDMDFANRAYELAAAHPDEQKFEQLPPFTADGRLVLAGSSNTLDSDFTSAAFALADGATSDVVQSSSGWHVIRRIEALPANQPDDAQLRSTMAATLAAEAKKRHIEQGLLQLRAATKIEVAPYADNAMAKVTGAYAP